MFFENYKNKLIDALAVEPLRNVETLARELRGAITLGKQVFLCGNGGSAANAVHLANDFLYGVSKKMGKGMRVEALSANPSVLTCLANDIGYEHIFSFQLEQKALSGDILVILSGSGNSPNVVRALETAKNKNMKSYAILGFSGGECKRIADTSIHFPVPDMQISEDLQLVVGHMCMQWINQHGEESNCPPRGMKNESRGYRRCWIYRKPLGRSTGS